MENIAVTVLNIADWIILNGFVGLLNGLFLTKFVARVDDKRPIATALWIGATIAAIETGNQVWALSGFSVWSLVTYVLGAMVAAYIVVRYERKR